MTQQVLHARVILPSAQANTDDCTMGITFEATGSDTTLDFTAPTNPDTIVTGFFNQVLSGASQALAWYLSTDLNRGANTATTEWYDVTGHLDGSPAGSPVRVTQWTLGATTATFNLPPACAVCLSLRASYGTDIEAGTVGPLPSSESAIDQGAPATHSGRSRPRARDRGRIYLGPLNINGIQAHAGLLSAQFLTDLQVTTQSTFITFNGGLHNQFRAVIWSRRAAAVKSVQFYALPQAISYQRRRADENLARVHSWTALV